MSFIRPTLISEADPDFEKKATPAMRRAAELAAKAPPFDANQAKKFGLEAPATAKYKIELTFGPHRTMLGPNVCAIQLWESGKKLHGGGDALMYWCKDTESDQGCWGIIPSDAVAGAIANCPSCQWTVRADRLTNMRVVKISTQKIAGEVAKLWRQLGGSADIYCKYHQTDVRYQAMLRDKGIRAARRLKGMFIYPLNRLIADTANGASLEGRIFAFLTA